MPIRDDLPHCAPFRLSSPYLSEYEQFLGVLQSAPQEITQDLEEPLQRFRTSFEAEVTELHKLRPLSKVQNQDKLDGEVLSNFGNILLNAYRSNGAEQLLRALLTMRWASLKLVPSLNNKLNLADTLFDLCRHVTSTVSLALSLFMAAETDLRKTMCNAKVILLLKQLNRLAEAETYAVPCNLSVAQLHLQNPQVPTQPWWTVEDNRLPRWIRNLATRPVVQQIRSDLRQCLETDPAAFDDSANDWFFVGSRQRWTGLNLMHSARGGWQRWCAGCARKTCERLRWRSELNHSLWKTIKGTIQGTVHTGPHPPLYVNFYALAAGAHIIPHLGNDLRLTIHLALEVPPGNQSRIRVADQTVNYTRPGQLLIFDDAYDHEVWNDAVSFVRYVLGITIWHPELLNRYQQPPEVPSYNFLLCWLGMKATKESKLQDTCSGRVLCISNGTQGEQRSTAHQT